MKIGIFGGSFDPLHFGHIRAMQVAKETAELDTVCFIPSKQSPFKSKTFATEKQRFEMTKTAIEENTNEYVSSMEIDRNKNSFMIDNVKELHIHNLDAELYLVVGDDCVPNLRAWKDYEKLMKYLNGVIVIPRISKVKYPVHFGPLTSCIVTPLPLNTTSSTYVRKRVKENKPLFGLVPKTIEEYIYDNNLYKSED